MSTEEMVAFLQAKLDIAENAQRDREQSQQIWQGGTAATWRKAGCKMTKAERLKTAARQGRIAEKCRREVESYKAIIARIQPQPTHTDGP